MREYYEEQSEPTEQSYLNYSRRDWIKLASLALASTQIPFFLSCSNNDNGEDNQNSPLPEAAFQYFSSEEAETVISLLDLLLPSTDDGPGALDMGADKYFFDNLKNGLFTEDNHTFFIENIKQFNLTFRENYSTSFTKSSFSDQCNFVDQTIEDKSFRILYSRLITVGFESLLYDPIYGVNINRAGWNWLEQSAPMPSPKDATKFPDLLTTINSSYGKL